MKKIASVLVIFVLLLFVTACGKDEVSSGAASQTDFEEELISTDSAGSEKDPVKKDHLEENQTEENQMEEYSLKMMIGDTEVQVEWEENESVKALGELVKEEPLTVSMSMYGGFEQVGSLGKSLPRNDEQTTTQACDIVLYSGDQIVIFYGSNSWAYTRLGHITDKTEAEMTELLGNGNVIITLSAE